jgi:GNAT superfamily N-acetyltransferase
MTRDTRTHMAGTSDRRTLGEMDSRVAGDMHRREMIDAAISARCCWVAERSGRVVGYGVLTRNFFARDFVELLFVAEDARRSGAGSAILAGIERAVHADRLFTSTNQSNAAMRALLATRGYAESGRIENLDPGDPELVFVKFLRG